MARQAKRRDAEESLFVAARDTRPLAARMRPRSLAEFVGQPQLLAPSAAFRTTIERGETGSLILWGPPGTGKTTLGHLIATATHRSFVPFSAVSEGVPRLREIFDDARERIAAGGAATLLFVDEIHRLNKAQQDTLLPAVEEGTVTLIGATTENPSFELNAALLSRARVVVLQPLTADDIVVLLRRALEDEERGIGTMALAVEEDVLRDAMQRRMPQHDRAGESHFNMLSAYHKSLRGSDPQGALYWMARMIEAGEDPIVLCRRAMAMAAEDIGLADPEALKLAVAARDAVHMLGVPEALLPLAEMTIYLATAPKSNSVKAALDAALDAARRSPAAPVPVHLRNAPTRLMKDLGYGRDYQYAHDDPSHFIPQQYLPDEVAGERFYEPGEFGFEKRIAERMAWWAARAARADEEPGTGEADAG